jgi:hypothetical protein
MTRSDMLPIASTFAFSGVPALDGALVGESYVLGANAATGSGMANPASVVARVRTTNANDPVTLGGFLAVPVVTEPSAGTWGGTHVAFTEASTYDLANLLVISGNGLVSWSIVVPAGTTSFDLPDIRTLPLDHAALVSGALQTYIYVARLDNFAYGKLRLGQLSSNAWSAYAYDAINGTY